MFSLIFSELSDKKTKGLNLLRYRDQDATTALARYS